MMVRKDPTFTGALWIGAAAVAVAGAAVAAGQSAPGTASAAVPSNVVAQIQAATTPERVNDLIAVASVGMTPAEIGQLVAVAVAAHNDFATSIVSAAAAAHPEAVIQIASAALAALPANLRDTATGPVLSAAATAAKVSIAQIAGPVLAGLTSGSDIQAVAAPPPGSVIITDPQSIRIAAATTSLSGFRVQASTNMRDTLVNVDLGSNTVGGALSSDFIHPDSGFSIEPPATDPSKGNSGSPT